MHQRHARTCRPKRPGRPSTVRSIRAIVLRLAPSTVWEILKAAGIDPALQGSVTTWADFLRSQAETLLACDFIETVTLTGQRQ